MKALTRVTQQQGQQPETRGLKRRRQEFAALREAAEEGSMQARARLPGARRAVQRQQAEQDRRVEQARRLRRLY